MVQERSKLVVADNSGARLLQVIRILGSKRSATVGDMVVATVKAAEPRGAVKKSDVVRAVVVRVRKEHKRSDGSAIRFDDNAAVILQKESRDLVGTRVFGPVAREVRGRRFQRIISIAPEVW